MQIRKASLEDVESIADLFNDYRIWYEMKGDLPAAKEFLAARLKNGESQIFVGIDENSKMVAFTQLYPLFSSTRMKRLWLLNDLYVHPTKRGQGYGIALLEKAQTFTQETDAAALILETQKENLVGNQLYPKMGFKLDPHNHYYWDNPSH
jgi:ribosomal protein S18 acetylase RimI-like enzyme